MISLHLFKKLDHILILGNHHFFLVILFHYKLQESPLSHSLLIHIYHFHASVFHQSNNEKEH